MSWIQDPVDTEWKSDIVLCELGLKGGPDSSADGW